MTAYSFGSFATREKTNGEQPQLVTIKKVHVLGNEHEAPFASGPYAARTLFEHLGRELTNPDTGRATFDRLKEIYDGATVSGKRVQQRLLDRQRRAARLLSESDVMPTEEQFKLMIDLAAVQAELATKLLPGVQADGRANDSVIDDVDRITRIALRSITDERTSSGLTTGGELARNENENTRAFDPNAWSNELLDVIARSPDIDHSTDADVVVRFASLLNEFERVIPTAIPRTEELYEIDEAIDPYALAMTRDSLQTSMGLEDDMSSGQSEELTDQARQAVWTSMSMEEREFSATMIALTPTQRIDIGMQTINSTPPLIKLPEAELGQGRYDVRSNKVEKSHVYDNFIQMAGEMRVYPGPEAITERLQEMRPSMISSGVLNDRATYALVVDGDEQSVVDALARIANVPTDARLVIHADNPLVAERLVDARNAVMAAAGIEPSFKDGSDATREFGGWTLPGTGDRVLGSAPRDAEIVVAVSDEIIAYGAMNGIDTTSQSAAAERISAAKAMVQTAENDLQRADDAALASQDPKLVAAASAIREALSAGDESKGDENALKAADLASYGSADKKLMKEVARREVALAVANTAVSKATSHLGRLQRQNKSHAFARATPGDVARAQIIEASFAYGKLRAAYAPGENGVVEMRGSAAERKAAALLDGQEYSIRAFRQALGAGEGTRYAGRRSMLVTTVAGSNFFSEAKGAGKGVEAIKARIASLPKTGVIMTDANDKNPVVKLVAESGRPLLHAVAWRVTDEQNVIIDGRKTHMSDRETKLDLGVAVSKGRDGEKDGGYSRSLVAQDVKGAAIIVHGGGQMTARTYELVMEEAAKRGGPSHGLEPREAVAIAKTLIEKGVYGIELPKVADVKLARAIGQEAIIDFPDQVILGNDMGKDYHVAVLTRLASEAGTLASLIGKDGKSIPIAEGREHAMQFAKSIADNTRDGLSEVMSLPSKGEYGQLILASLPGVSSERAVRIGERHDTLGDVLTAAQAGEASPELPRNLHHGLGLATSWANAVRRADDIVDFSRDAQMDAIAATSPGYPETMIRETRTPMIYTLGEVELNAPTMALIVGSTSKANDADLEATREIAKSAAEKGWTVSLHMSGEASAKIASNIASMPEGERPRIVLIGDGHPTAHADPHVVNAVMDVVKAGGGYATVTAPTPREGSTQDQLRDDTFSYVADRRAALEFQARQASGVVLVKSTGNDMEMIAIKTAIAADKPVGAISPVSSETPGLVDMRFRTTDYSANRRMLQGGGAITVMLDTRNLAFQPNFIPDMTAQTKENYVLFEGSTAGQQNVTSRDKDDEIDRSALESGGTMSTSIDWGKAAFSVQDGRGMGSFIEAVELGQLESIRATEHDRNAWALERDAKFLDTSSRSTVSSDVRDIFSEIAERGAGDIDRDMQEHFMKQRSGAGR
jgi:hypothetical protein